MDGSLSIGDSFSWAQTYGEEVSLQDGTQTVATFVAEQAGTFAFDVLVFSGDAEDRDRVIVVVEDEIDIEGSEDPKRGGCQHTPNMNWMLLLMPILAYRRST